MSNENVTLKKKAPILQLVITLAFLIVLDISSKKSNAAYVVSLALSVLVVVFGVDFLIKTLWYACDKEKYVVVRKSSLENKTAENFLSENRKTEERYYAIGGIAGTVIATVGVVYESFYVLDPAKRTGGLVFIFLLMYAVWFFILRIGKKKISENSRKMVRLCDPELMFDVMEQKRTRIHSSVDTASILFVQVLAAYYMEDEKLMRDKFSKFAGINKNYIDEVLAIGFLGSMAINNSNQQGYERAVAKLKEAGEKGAAYPNVAKACDYVRNKWQVQIGVRDNDPDVSLDMAADTFDQVRDYRPINMEYTYLIARVQELKGLTDLAKSNYRVVADSAGKLKFRELAEERLREA